jgi:hypothetical protein
MSEPEPTDKYIPKWVLTTRNLILIIIGILTAWNTYISNATRSKLEAESTRLENLIKQKEFENGLRFKIFDEVKTAISQKDSILQEAVKVMIEAVLVEDSDFQDRMRTVLLASRYTVASVKRDIQNSDNFRKAQDTIFQNLESLNKAILNNPKKDDGKQQAVVSKKYIVDVFYLEDIIEESKVRAEKVARILKENNPDFIINLRLLPRTINAYPRYRIESNQIRFDEKEREIAEKIKQQVDLKKVFRLEPLELHSIKKETPNYISVFVRNM